MEHLAIFFDESGCLGSKSGSSKVFLATALVCYGKSNENVIKKAVYRTLKNKLKNKGGTMELKGMSTSLSVKKYFFRFLPPEGWALFSIILDKNNMIQFLRTKVAKEKMYNSIAQFLIPQIEFPKELKSVHIVFDKCKSTEEIRRFNRDLEKQLKVLLPAEMKLYIRHETSQANLGLQAVDLFSWGIFRKFDKNDLNWYDVFKHRIKLEEIYSHKSKTAPLIPIS